MTESKILINRFTRNPYNKHSYKFSGQLDVRKDAEGKLKKFIFFPSGSAEYIHKSSKVLVIPFQNKVFRSFAQKNNGRMVQLKFETEKPLDSDDMGFMVLPEKCQIISLEITDSREDYIEVPF